MDLFSIKLRRSAVKFLVLKEMVIWGTKTTPWNDVEMTSKWWMASCSCDDLIYHMLMDITSQSAPAVMPTSWLLPLSTWYFKIRKGLKGRWPSTCKLLKKNMDFTHGPHSSHWLKLDWARCLLFQILFLGFSKMWFVFCSQFHMWPIEPCWQQLGWPSCLNFI